jgi:hypothetical protein
MKIEPFTARIEYKFGVSVYEFKTEEEKEMFRMEARDWCVATFGRRNFTASFNTYYFMTEAQRTWFILKWS